MPDSSSFESAGINPFSVNLSICFFSVLIKNLPSVKEAVASGFIYLREFRTWTLNELPSSVEYSCGLSNTWSAAPRFPVWAGAKRKSGSSRRSRFMPSVWLAVILLRQSRTHLLSPIDRHDWSTGWNQRDTSSAKHTSLKPNSSWWDHLKVSGQISSICRIGIPRWPWRMLRALPKQEKDRNGL